MDFERQTGVLTKLMFSSSSTFQIINGSKIIGQIDNLMDAEYFEDAIFLTESGLRLLEAHFGDNLVEKTHNTVLHSAPNLLLSGSKQLRLHIAMRSPRQ